MSEYGNGKAGKETEGMLGEAQEVTMADLGYEQ